VAKEGVPGCNAGTVAPAAFGIVWRNVSAVTPQSRPPRASTALSTTFPAGTAASDAPREWAWALGARSIIAARLRGDSSLPQRNHLGPHRGQVSCQAPARDQRRGLRLPRLRQRRLDGHLPGQQRQGRLLLPSEAAAERPLPQQPGRHLHRCDREGRRGRGRLWHGGGRRRLQQRRITRYLCDAVRPEHPLSQQWRRNLHRCNGQSRSRGRRLVFERCLVRL
jgi:hypothetical protein